MSLSVCILTIAIMKDEELALTKNTLEAPCPLSPLCPRNNIYILSDGAAVGHGAKVCSLGREAKSTVDSLQKSVFSMKNPMFS